MNEYGPQGGKKGGGRAGEETRILPVPLTLAVL